MTSQASQLGTGPTGDPTGTPPTDGAGGRRGGVTTDRVRHPLVARRLVVVRTEEVGPTLRRVVLAGPDLDGFASVGVTDHVKLFVPAVAGDEPATPRIVDGEWVNRRDPALTYREITVRTHAPGVGELALEMVTGAHGAMSRWAAQAAPGQEVVVLGPKTSVLRPLDRARYVLAADETGLPAVRNWLDRLPASAQVTALIEVGRRGTEVPLPTRAGLEVAWVYRSDANAETRTGATSGAGSRADGGDVAGAGSLADAVELLLAQRPADVAGAWWWVAGEASQVRRIRVAVTAALPGPQSLTTSAYWSRGVSHFDHKAPDA